MLQNCKSGLLVGTEKDGQIALKFDCLPDSERTAKDFQKVVEGFKAPGNLRYNYQPDVVKVMDGITCEIKDGSFRVAWVATAADLEAAVRAAVEQKAARNPEGKGKKHHGAHERARNTPAP